MARKRKIEDIILTSAVGIFTLIGGGVAVEYSFDALNRISPQLEKYVGVIGSNVIRYGFPGMIAIGTLGLTCTALKATDRYFLEKNKHKY